MSTTTESTMARRTKVGTTPSRDSSSSLPPTKREPRRANVPAEPRRASLAEALDDVEESAPTVWSTLRDAAQQGASEAEAFERVKALGWEVLRPIIGWVYRHCQRGVVRALEHRTWRTLDRVGPAPPASPIDRIEARSMILAEHCALPSGEYVAWGEMTAEQHRQRAAWYFTQSDALRAAGDRHIEAAREIEENGVHCLNDLRVRGAA